MGRLVLIRLVRQMWQSSRCSGGCDGWIVLNVQVHTFLLSSKVLGQTEVGMSDE